jgi:hypothetical protein
MRIDFRIDGGLAAFPGLAQPVRIDCAALPAAQTAHLQQLVDRADFFSLPKEEVPARRPDARAYTIAIDDGRQCRTLTVTEPIADPALRELVAELRVQANAARRAR